MDGTGSGSTDDKFGINKMNSMNSTDSQQHTPTDSQTGGSSNELGVGGGRHGKAGKRASMKDEKLSPENLKKMK